MLPKYKTLSDLQAQELELMILVDLFQLRIFYGSMKLLIAWGCQHKGACKFGSDLAVY